MQNDFDEATTVVSLLQKLDSIDAGNVDSISNDIFKKQPFFLSVLLGYQFDVTPQQLEEIMKVYFLIWEYFKGNKNIQKKKVTVQLFEKIQARNISMLKYAENESKNQRTQIYEHDLQNLKSKALIGAIFLRFKTCTNLADMDGELKGIILIGIKTFIECFETITTE
jgi:hypothetical protein